MNAFVQKEIRLLLPTAMAALLVAFSTLLLSDADSSSGMSVALRVLPYVLSPALVLMMALDSFGREISAGTFSQLLAQPICRKKIWRTKALLLCVATVLVCLIWCLCFVGNKNISVKPAEMRDTLLTAILVPLVIVSGGLWTVLLLRQVAAAFWFTVIVPAALAFVTTLLAQKFSTPVAPAIVAVLAIYGIAGIIFARWLFLRAQDVQWTGGVIALPKIFSFTKSRTTSALRLRHPRTALFLKEIQLHQSQILIAVVLLMLHLIVVAMRKFAGTFGSPVLGLTYQSFWILWFVMPFLIGCAAVAEERKLGTLETQFCLPVSRRTQFRIKLFTVLFLSLFMAILIPWLIEGNRIFHLNNLLFPGIVQLVSFSGILVLVGIALGIAAISFYASTFSRNTLQALEPAVLGMIIGAFLLAGAERMSRIETFTLWNGWLIYFIGVPVMAVTLRFLMFWNFKDVFFSGKLWLRNSAAFVVSLAFIVGITTLVYHRAWEFLMPLESSHGPARLHAQNVRLQQRGDSFVVLLPDGKVWNGIYFFATPSSRAISLNSWKLVPVSEEKFLEGNWSDVAISREGMIGIQTDGTLWASEKPQFNAKGNDAKLVQIGGDHDWKSVSGYYPHSYLLKTNGTLWEIDPKWNSKKPWPGIEAFPPLQLGTNIWSEILRMNSERFSAMKKGAHGFHTGFQIPIRTSF